MTAHILLAGPHAPLNYIFYCLSGPPPAISSFHAPVVHLSSDGRQIPALLPKRFDSRPDSHYKAVRLRHGRGPCPHNIRLRSPQAHAPCLRRLQSRFRPFGYHVALMLGHSRQNVDGEPGSIRHIAGPKLHPALHEVRDQRHRPSEPVELRDQQWEPLPSAQLKGFAEFRPVCLSAALHFREFGDQAPAGLGEILSNGRTLGFKPKSGAALPVGRYAIVGDPLRKNDCLHGEFQSLNVRFRL